MEWVECTWCCACPPTSLQVWNSYSGLSPAQMPPPPYLQVLPQAAEHPLLVSDLLQSTTHPRVNLPASLLSGDLSARGRNPGIPLKPLKDMSAPNSAHSRHLSPAVDPEETDTASICTGTSKVWKNGVQRYINCAKRGKKKVEPI